MFRITKETQMGELLRTFPSAAGILTEMGMHCVGCPSSHTETLEQAADIHGMDADDLVEDLKGFLEI